ncbi:MAG: DUF4783 domain-containing protein [Bacteroidota bacterium]|nr:DUF4783 domain-containing protein [Bacteroidota bacterium]
MIKSILILIFSLVTHIAFAGDGKNIASAIQNANTNELSTYFNSSVELTTPASSGIKTRDQAKIILDNFFKNNIPVKATIAHETSGSSNIMIVISLVTKNGTYRITIIGTQKVGSALVINEIKIQ